MGLSYIPFYIVLYMYLHHNSVGACWGFILYPWQGCHGQGKISGKLNFFKVREKAGNFVDGQGNLERTWKVREKSGNSKINGYGRQT